MLAETLHPLMKVEDVLGVTDGTNGGLGCGKMKKVFFFVFFFECFNFSNNREAGLPANSQKWGGACEV